MESKIISRTVLFLRIYFIFCSIGLFCYVLYFGLFGAIGLAGVLAESDSEDAIGFLIMGFCSIIPLILFGLNVFAAFRVDRRTHNNWILMVVLVGFGLINPYTMLPSIFLMITLLDDEVKEYYKNEEAGSGEVVIE